MSRRVAVVIILLFISAALLPAQTPVPAVVGPEKLAITPARDPVSSTSNPVFFTSDPVFPTSYPTPTSQCLRETAATPPLPDTPSSATPLTPKQKFQTFAKSTYSPYTFATAAVGASWAQLWDGSGGYGGGMSGWGERYGAILANAEGRKFFNSFLFPVMFHQDPRYIPSNKHGLFPRAWYAGTRVVVARSDDGTSMFNYSEILSVLVMSSIQNSYYPDRDRGSWETLNRFTGGLSSDATDNLLKEFTPEIKRIARKIVPKRAQKLEEKIPEPVRKIGAPIMP